MRRSPDEVQLRRHGVPKCNLGTREKPDAIRDFHLETSVPIGMKPAGGIRTAKLALHFLVAGKETLGDDWLTNTRYRFGASALLNDLLRQIEKERTSAYQAAYAFSEATSGY